MSQVLRNAVEFDEDAFVDLIQFCDGIKVIERTVESSTEHLERYPFASSGIDWVKHQPVLEASLKTPSDSEQFVRDAFAAMSDGTESRVLFVADHWINKPLEVPSKCISTLAKNIHTSPCGYMLGPIDCTWDWVIDIRFARAAFAGRINP